MQRAATRTLWGLGPGLFVAVFFFLPLLDLATYAFSQGGADAFGTAVRHVATTPYYRNRIVFTFEQAALSTLLTLLVGLPLAYAFSQYRFWGRRFLRALLTAPFLLPPLVVALALQEFLGPSGPARILGVDLLGAMGPLGAILFAHVFYEVSLVVRIVGGFWDRIPTEYHDAAHTLGSTRVGVVRRVLLPLGAPAIVAASALVFLFTTSSFGIILLLGGPRAGTLETLIWENVNSFSPDLRIAAVLGMLQLATTLSALVLYLAFQRRATTRFPPAAGHDRPSLPASAWTLLGPALLLTLGPLVALALAAFRYQGHWGFDAFQLLAAGRPAIGNYTLQTATWNSLRFGVLTVLVTLPLAVALAYAFHGARRRSWFLEAGLLAPLGTSSVLVGLGYLLAFDGDPFWDLRASAGRIVLAHVLLAFPFVSRILTPSLGALEPRLAEAARTLGARTDQVVRRIELPLLRPALRAAAIYAFAASLGEFGATLLLRRPENTTLPLAIFDAYARPGEPFRAQAEALSLILVLVSVAAFWLIEFGRRRPGGEFA